MTDQSNPDIIKVRQLKKSDWPYIEQLFGEKGACGGCWCMHWRIPKGGKMWDTAKGEPNRQTFKKIVESGKVFGILAFDGSIPVAWCSFGKRLDFPRTETVKAYRHEFPNSTWVINCFFLAKGYRGLGLGYRMVEAAIKGIKQHKGKFVEAYPVTLTKDGKQLPAAFSFTGPEKIFIEHNFKEIQRLAQSRPLYRLEL